VNGFVATDIVTFAGITVQNQGFGLATTAINNLDAKIKDEMIGFEVRSLVDDKSFTACL
jgi:hypothetical protein